MRCAGLVAAARAHLARHCALPPQRFLADAFETAKIPAAMRAGSVVHIDVALHDGRRRQVAIEAGASLYSGLKAANLIQGVCGGSLSCGTCRGQPDRAWSARIAAAGRGEKRLLAALDGVADGDTGQQLHDYARAITEQRGWQLNLELSGHRLAEFPHAAAFDGAMAEIGFRPSARHPRHAYGAYFEDLLLDPQPPY